MGAVDPDLWNAQGMNGFYFLTRRVGCTLFSVFDGLTHEGKTSAASISKNSPSESKVLPTSALKITLYSQ